MLSTVFSHLKITRSYISDIYRKIHSFDDYLLTHIWAIWKAPKINSVVGKFAVFSWGKLCNLQPTMHAVYFNIGIKYNVLCWYFMSNIFSHTTFFYTTCRSCSMLLPYSFLTKYVRAVWGRLEQSLGSDFYCRISILEGLFGPRVLQQCLYELVVWSPAMDIINGKTIFTFYFTSITILPKHMKFFSACNPISTAYQMLDGQIFQYFLWLYFFSSVAEPTRHPGCFWLLTDWPFVLTRRVYWDIVQLFNNLFSGSGSERLCGALLLSLDIM